MADGYISNYGNIENNGLSWVSPKKTLQNAIDSGFLYNKYVSGFFREAIELRGYFIGDGFFIFDGTLLPGVAISISSNGSYFKNATIQNCDVIVKDPWKGTNNSWENCIFKNSNYLNLSNFSIRIKDSVVSNIKDGGQPNLENNNTVFNSILTISASYENVTLNNIFSESEIEINHDIFIQYSLFHNSTFKFTGGDQGADETTYTAPTGANDTEKLENLRTRMATVYGGVASQYLQNCRYQTDGDLFIDPAKENFYLVPGCQAARMSYEAGYIGKYPEGSLADFAGDFVSYTNIDASGNIIDQTVDSTAETDIVDLLKLRHINSLEALGQRAARNGNAVNVDADLGPAINPGTALTDGKTYIVRDEAISQTATGKTRDVGETFIATTADGLDFTSATGYVQEVYLDKPRSIELKVSKTDPALTSAVWLKMDLYAEPRINYDVNGVPQYGNLDPNYDEATSERLFIRYWKARVTIQAKNLPA